MSVRYSEYDPFAWLYNQHWGNMFTPVAMAAIDTLVLPHLPAGAKMLDLCCGTGQLACLLSERGYRVTGIDGSEQMLQYARINAPGVEFVLNDVRYCSTTSQYDAVVCVFDSLNHIMSIDELSAVFCRVYNALKDGGLFLFDLNTESGYNYRWNGFYGIIEDDHVCIIRNSYEPQDRLALFDATLFRLEGGEWGRSDFTLQQRCYPEPEVHTALETAGMAGVQVYEFTRESGLKAFSAEAHKAFFLCHKPENMK
jgi:SAM-dependent methyltransferase